jgi:hypothetical protein
MAKPYVHVLLANRQPHAERGKPRPAGRPIPLRAGRKDITLAVGTTAEVVLTWEQFEELRRRQPQALRRELGVPRIVDFWRLDAEGNRVPVE